MEYDDDGLPVRTPDEALDVRIAEKERRRGEGDDGAEAEYFATLDAEFEAECKERQKRQVARIPRRGPSWPIDTSRDVEMFGDD